MTEQAQPQLDIVAQYEGHIEILNAEKQVINQTLTNSINNAIQLNTSVILLQNKLAQLTQAKDIHVNGLQSKHDALEIQLEALKEINKSLQARLNLLPQGILEAIEEQLKAAEQEDNGAVHDDCIGDNVCDNKEADAA